MTEPRRLAAEAAAALADAGVASPEYDAATLLAHALGTSRATVLSVPDVPADRAASFRDLVADCEERIQIVVRFLALLELYREGMVDLAQAATFGEIDVRWEGEAA